MEIILSTLEEPLAPGSTVMCLPTHVDCDQCGANSVPTSAYDDRLKKPGARDKVECLSCGAAHVLVH